MAQHIKNKFTYQYSLAYFHLKYKGHTWESNIHNYKERNGETIYTGLDQRTRPETHPIICRVYVFLMTITYGRAYRQN